MCTESVVHLILEISVKFTNGQPNPELPGVQSCRNDKISVATSITPQAAPATSLGEGSFVYLAMGLLDSAAAFKLA